MPRSRRWMPLVDVRKAMVDLMGEHAPTERTLQRWCREGQVPARRMLAWGVTANDTKRGGRFQWMIDLRELKAGSQEGRELYEAMFGAGDDDDEAA